LPGTDADLRRRRQLLLAIICAALVLRLGSYLADKSLWLDEAMLGLQIMQRPFSAALHPVGQIAPTGFMWAVKAITVTIGDSEPALRLVPLLSAIASVFLFFIVAERSLEWPANLLAIGLFAVSDRLIYYSAELKQYSTDVAIVLLVYLTMADAASQGLNRRKAIRAGCVGALAVWFSHPSIFVLAGLGATAAFVAWRRGAREQVGPLAFTFSLWILSMAVSYLLTIRGVSAAHDQLRVFWGFAFAPLPPISIADLRWFPDTFADFFRDPSGFVLPGIAAFAFLAGCMWMFKEQPNRCLLLLSPIPIVLLASALHAYPFSGRMVLFLVPLALLLIAHGAARISALLSRSSRLIAATFLLLLIAPPVADATYGLMRPRTNEEIRPVMRHVRDAWKEGDRLYVYYGAKPAFEYYASRYGLAGVPTSFGTASREDWQKYITELDTLRGRRVWILFTHVYDWGSVNEERLFLFHLDRIGTRLRQINGRRASAYLYDVSGAE
jgi:hypothetical protein